MKKDDNLVSVIVPVYMVQDYLDTCVTSIINQSYKNIEIILVDDGSKDQSGQICDKYANLYEKVKVIHKENGGLSDARNVGIQEANGEYIVFIDSDDYIHPQMIEKLLQPIAEGSADMSVCDYIYVKDDQLVKHTDENNADIAYLCSFEDRTEYFYDDNNHITFDIVVNKMYPRSFFEDILFPKGKIHEDEFTTYKLLEKANKIAYVKQPLYYYCYRENSIMGQKFKESNLVIFDAFSERIEGYIKMANYLWAAKVLRMYRIRLSLFFYSIKEYGGYDYSILEEPIKNYKRLLGKCFWKMPVTTKEKLIFLLSYVSPRLYLIIKT